MSTLITADTGEFIDVALPLMKEYADKLTEAWNQKTEVRDGRFSREVHIELRNNADIFIRRLLAGARILSQFASSRLEHMEIDELERLRLKLRLADLENAMIRADQLARI